MVLVFNILFIVFCYFFVDEVVVTRVGGYISGTSPNLSHSVLATPLRFSFDNTSLKLSIAHISPSSPRL